MNEAAPQKRDFGTSPFTTGDRKVNPITSLRSLAVARKLDSRAALQSFIIPPLSGGKVVL